MTNKDLMEKILKFFSDVPTTSHALNKLRSIKQGSDEPESGRKSGELNSITLTVVMELYLGSVIEPIRKCIHDKLYFNSKHAPKTLGEAMQKALDLHIKHLYAMGEDQQDISTASSENILPEITVNEFNT